MWVSGRLTTQRTKENQPEAVAGPYLLRKPELLVRCCAFTEGEQHLVSDHEACRHFIVWFRIKVARTLLRTTVLLMVSNIRSDPRDASSMKHLSSRCAALLKTLIKWLWVTQLQPTSRCWPLLLHPSVVLMHRVHVADRGDAVAALTLNMCLSSLAVRGYVPQLVIFMMSNKHNHISFSL